MKLKERILNKAVELFQERGIAMVSPNQIAAALDISTGNLTYHFKTKANLVQEVYARINPETCDFIPLEGTLTLEDFRQMMVRFRDFMAQHSFFFHDLVYILRTYPEVKKVYEATNLMCLKQVKALFENFVASGLMLPEQNGINYDFLTHNVWMVGAFWNTQSTIFTSGDLFESPMDLVDMTWYMLLPYLTEKGREEYDRIREQVEEQKSTA
ncbi:MAG TPA: TetR family transcriptional regulator [Cytophagales bacterium]|nr:TetR family transcriptional regulator [Cytophagales bacterium]HAP62237.1 TetR family transcriptional regulator [Cytophagales bacterium]